MGMRQTEFDSCAKEGGRMECGCNGAGRKWNCLSPCRTKDKRSRLCLLLDTTPELSAVYSSYVEPQLKCVYLILNDEGKTLTLVRFQRSSIEDVAFSHACLWGLLWSEGPFHGGFGLSMRLSWAVSSRKPWTHTRNWRPWKLRKQDAAPSTYVEVIIGRLAF